MKKILYLFTIFLLIPLALAIEEDVTTGIYTVTTTTEKMVGGQDNPNLVVATLRYEPYPVEQGNYFDLWLKIWNTGNDQADDMAVSILPSSSFIYTGPEIKTGIVPSGQYAVVKIEDIKVNPETPSGPQELKVQLNPGGSYRYEPKTVQLSIEVAHLEAALEPEIYTIPERVTPGQIFTLVVNLENVVASSVRNVVVTVDPSSEFVTVGSTNEKRVSWVLPNKNKIVEFEMIADPDIESKPYKVLLRISYYGDDGSLISSGANHSIGILVEAPIQYQLDLEDSKVGTAGQIGEVIIAFSNIGPSEIKYSSIELIPTKQYDVVSVPRTYLGNLEPDDYETVDFKIRTKTSRDIQLKLKIRYKTAYNEEFEDTEYVTLPMYSKSKAVAYGLAQPTKGLSSLIFWIIIIALIYTFYKEWRKLRKIEPALKITLQKALRFTIKLIKKLHPRYLKTLPKKIKLKIKSIFKEYG